MCLWTETLAKAELLEMAVQRQHRKTLGAVPAVPYEGASAALSAN